MNTDTRLRELINEWCSGNIDPESMEELDDLLNRSPENRQLFLEYRAAESALRSVAYDHEEAMPPNQTRWQTYAIGILATCVIVLLASAVVFWPSPSNTIATISGKSGAVLWTGDGGEVFHDLNAGDAIGGGTLETLASDSWAKITFPDGSNLAVSGHSAITISEQKDQKIMRLREGTISLHASKQPARSPMLLVTPSAEVRVLGTQLNVSADSFSTRVNVNEGLVEVERLADGSVQKVPERHLVVASLETNTEFSAVPRQNFVEIWKSNLPHDRRYGEWRPRSEELPGAQQARPLLWRENPERPLLLHVASIDPSPGDSPPVRLASRSRLRIQGRLHRPHKLIFGITAYKMGGGFTGKYSLSAMAEPNHEKAGQFEAVFPIEDFQREKKVFPPSLLGLELADFWALSISENVGLEIIEVELIK